jgi:glycerol-3-phosphate acyltransferase PlsY
VSSCLALAALGAYLLGSVPFGLLIAGLRGRDPRRHGSGNIGATNVARVSGWGAGIATLALDVGKGAAAVAAAAWLCSDPRAPAAAALGAVLGHVFPLFLRLRGGKGVATAAGAFTVLSPPAMAGAGLLFAALVAISRRVSAGSVAAALSLPFLSAWLAPGDGRVPAAAAAALLIVVRHRDNLRRLAAGTEPRLGERPP